MNSHQVNGLQRGRRVVVMGGGLSAVILSKYLLGMGNEVVLID
jgi:thioredoxin reductase